MTAPGRAGDGRDLVAGEVKADVLATDDRLDDMRRARLAARIDAELDHRALAPTAAGTARSWRRPLRVGLMLGGAGMAAAVALAIVGTAGDRGEPRSRGIASTGAGRERASQARHRRRHLLPPRRRPSSDGSRVRSIGSRSRPGRGSGPGWASVPT